jgi:hypothetical protein
VTLSHDLSSPDTQDPETAFFNGWLKSGADYFFGVSGLPSGVIEGIHGQVSPLFLKFFRSDKEIQKNGTCHR